MPISDQFACARREAERRGWTIRSMSFDSTGLHVDFTLPDSHVHWLEPLYERLMNRFGPR
jgi:hypothetical protein